MFLNLTCSKLFQCVLGLSVYIQATVNINQNFLKVVVHVIITDQWSQTKCLYEIQITVIYSSAILVTVMSECHVKRVICKTWTRTLANNADPDRSCRMQQLIKVCTVCLNHRKPRVKVPIQDHFSQSTLRDIETTSAVSALFFLIHMIIKVYYLLSITDKTRHAPCLMCHNSR